MRSSRGPGWTLTLAATGTVLFLHVPLAIIVLYAFSAEEATFVFPPPALTSKWFAVALARDDIHAALGLSLRGAGIGTAIAIVF